MSLTSITQFVRFYSVTHWDKKCFNCGTVWTSIHMVVVYWSAHYNITFQITEAHSKLNYTQQIRPFYSDISAKVLVKPVGFLTDGIPWHCANKKKKKIPQYGFIIYIYCCINHCGIISISQTPFCTWLLDNRCLVRVKESTN